MMMGHDVILLEIPVAKIILIVVHCYMVYLNQRHSLVIKYNRRYKHQAS